jgi:hypothetical protein
LALPLNVQERQQAPRNCCVRALQKCTPAAVHPCNCAAAVQCSRIALRQRARVPTSAVSSRGRASSRGRLSFRGSVPEGLNPVKRGQPRSHVGPNKHPSPALGRPGSQRVAPTASPRQGVCARRPSPSLPLDAHPKSHTPALPLTVWPSPPHPLRSLSKCVSARPPSSPEIASVRPSPRTTTPQRCSVA